MATRLLFREDAYLRIASARAAEIGGIRVLRIRSEGKRNKRVEIALKD
jgi:Ser-tRNA(Ala) deacylase AlaX